MKNIYIFCLIILSASACCAQSLTGMSGMLSIPTAELNNEKTVVVGLNYLNKKFLDYTKEKYSAFDIYASLTYLPFLELGARVTRIRHLPDASHHNVDRMFSIRLRLFEQGDYFPSVAVGANNPVSTLESANHFNCLYIAASKKVSFNSFIKNISLNAGYGSDIINAADHEFIGLFGGVSLQLFNFMQFITEYDARHINGGAKVTLFHSVHFLMCWKAYKYFNGGVSFSFGI